MVAVLKLLGLDGPRPAGPAATVLQIAVADSAAPAALHGARGYRVHPGPPREVVFTLDDPVTVLPIRNLTLEAGGQDRTADLLAGRGVALLPADGGPGEARISLDLAAPVPGGQLSLLLCPTWSPRDIPPAWAPDATDGVPPPAELTWSYDDGTRVPIDAAQVEDGTQGLRRSGHRPAARPGVLGHRRRGAITAAEHRPGDLRRPATAAAARGQRRGGPAPAGRQPRRAGRAGPPMAAAPGPAPGSAGRTGPAAGRLPDAAGAGRHGARVDPGRRLRLLRPRGPGVRARPGSRRAAVRRRTHRADTGPRPRAPGESAARRSGGPSAAAPAATAGRPATWSGTGGAVSATAANLVPAAGGADAETIAQARGRAGAALHEVRRAVTAADHETIAQQAPGVAVARAHAAVGDHPGYPCTLVPGAVSVYVVPDAPRGDADWDRPDFVPAPLPDPGLLSQVRATLCAARLLGEELFIREPRYRVARLRVEVAGAPRDPAAAVRAGAGRAAPVPGPADRRRRGRRLAVRRAAAALRAAAGGPAGRRARRRCQRGRHRPGRHGQLGGLPRRCDPAAGAGRGRRRQRSGSAPVAVSRPGTACDEPGDQRGVVGPGGRVPRRAPDRGRPGTGGHPAGAAARHRGGGAGGDPGPDRRISPRTGPTRRATTPEWPWSGCSAPSWSRSSAG